MPGRFPDRVDTFGTRLPRHEKIGANFNIWPSEIRRSYRSL